MFWTVQLSLPWYMLQNYDICTELLFLIDEEDALAESKGEHGTRVVQTA